MKTFDLLIGAIIARLQRWIALARLHPNMSKITRNIWIGGANSPELITSKGFDAVLDLRARDDDGYRTSLEDCGIVYLNIKISDGHGASPYTLLRIVEWLVDRSNKGEKLLAHCNLGRGRAALATAAYLMYEGKTPEVAIKTIKERRRTTFFNERQREALEKFSEMISSRT